MKYAGFWVRVLAMIIDGILLSIVFVPILRALFPADVVSYAGMESGVYNIGMNLSNTASILYMLIVWIYFVVLTVLLGGTLGKMALKIKVVDEKGNKINWGQAILREVVGKFISTIILLLGYIWVAFDAKKQGWHDKIAKTYVVYK